MTTSLPTRHRLLYAESCVDLRERVSVYLLAYGFDVTPIPSAAEARILLQAHRFDLILLDLPAPEDEAWAFLEFVARRGQPPIVVTSTMSEATDRVLVIEAGADDYLVKPFDRRELVARLRALVRRAGTDDSLPARRLASLDRWLIDVQARRATCGREVVELTAGEMAILHALMEHPRRVMSRVDLLASTGRDDGEVFDRTIDVLVSRLRRKLEREPRRPEIVQTVRGGGYYLGCTVGWDAERESSRMSRS